MSKWQDETSKWQSGKEEGIGDEGSEWAPCLQWWELPLRRSDCQTADDQFLFDCALALVKGWWLWSLEEHHALVHEGCGMLACCHRVPACRRELKRPLAMVSSWRTQPPVIRTKIPSPARLESLQHTLMCATSRNRIPHLERFAEAYRE